MMYNIPKNDFTLNMRIPTSLKNEIDMGFPLTRPGWDYNTAGGRESLKIYRQALVAGLRGASRRPTNLAKVREVMQGPHNPITSKAPYPPSMRKLLLLLLSVLPALLPAQTIIELSPGGNVRGKTVEDYRNEAKMAEIQRQDSLQYVDFICSAP